MVELKEFPVEEGEFLDSLFGCVSSWLPFMLLLELLELLSSDAGLDRLKSMFVLQNSGLLWSTTVLLT